MSPEHIIFIPAVFLIGLVVGYVMGAKAARNERARARAAVRD
jgi:hypothetical protein